MVYFPSAIALNTYLPFESVDTPLVVPLIFTVTPISVSPDFLSETVPEILPVCAKTDALKNTQMSVKSALFRVSCTFNLLGIYFQQSYYHNVRYMLPVKHHSFKPVLS